VPSSLPAAVSTIDVRPGYHPFVDHRFIHAGTARWVDAAERYHSPWGFDRPAAVHAAHRGVPRGVRLRLQPAERSDPVLRPTEPWERLLWWPKVMRDAGRYRLWYEAVPPDHWDPSVRLPAPWDDPVFGELLCYAESDDGIAWRKPKLGIGTWSGDSRTNVVLGRELAGPMGLHGVSVFLDPHAQADERYKALWFAEIPPGDRARLARERPDDVDPRAGAEGPRRGVYGATSPDGLRWHVGPEPLALYGSDTLQVAEWDDERQAYVWYARGHFHGRRTIARAQSPDFWRFPLPQPVLVEPPFDPAAIDLYTNGKTRYPGDPSTHLMFPTFYDRSTDGSAFGVAASADGVAWTWVDRSVALGPGGSFDAGSMFAGTGLVELPGGLIGFPYCGYTTPHKHPANLCASAVAWCTWPRGRIAGLEAPEDGEFWTPPLRLRGRRLRLNVRTAPDGWVRMGLLTSAWTPIDGFGLDLVSVISGDHAGADVVWGAGAALPATSDHDVILHVRLQRATLFGFELLV